MQKRSNANPSTLAPPVSIPEADRSPLLASSQWRCPRCGSTDLASAYLVDYGDRFRQLRLAPKALKLGRIGRLLRPFQRLVRVGARVCRECGAVTMEVDPEEFNEAEERYGRR